MRHDDGSARRRGPRAKNCAGRIPAMLAVPGMAMPALLGIAILAVPAMAIAGATAGTAAEADSVSGDNPASFDILLRGGRVIDGTGNPWTRADVGIRADRIAAIGRLDGATARRTIDVRHLVVAPGFIDLLGQSEFTVLADPEVLSKITQGITTELTGEGGSVGPMTSFGRDELRATLSHLELSVDWSDHAGYFRRLERQGSTINFAHLVGAAQVRQAVLQGDDREATAKELDRMRRHVARAMEQGAFGLSSSLIYPPGAFAGTAELTALAQVASDYGGIYATHVRNESHALLASIAEAVRIGEQADLPVEIWHLKAAGRANWGHMRAALDAIEAARQRGVDVAADIYPYPAAMTGLTACLPPSASEGGVPALLERLRDPASRAAIRSEIEKPSPDWENFLLESGGADQVLVAGVRKPDNKRFQGKRLSEIAALKEVDAIDAIFELLLSEDGAVDAIYFLMSEEDVALALASPWIGFNCDAAGVRPDGRLGSMMTHPRAYGSFPRILGRYVREEKLLSLEAAVRKMTSLAASRIGLIDRGLLRPGLYADVTVFDPDVVADRATFEAPHRLSIGIEHVFVNGRQVLDHGQPTGALPGRILRGPGYRPGR